MTTNYPYHPRPAPQTLVRLGNATPQPVDPKAWRWLLTATMSAILEGAACGTRTIWAANTRQPVPTFRCPLPSRSTKKTRTMSRYYKHTCLGSCDYNVITCHSSALTECHWTSGRLCYRLANNLASAFILHGWWCFSNLSSVWLFCRCSCFYTSIVELLLYGSIINFAPMMYLEFLFWKLYWLFNWTRQ